MGGMGTPATSCTCSTVASLIPAWFFRPENTVEGNIVLVLFFHPLYLFPGDMMNISSVESTVTENTSI